MKNFLPLIAMLGFIISYSSFFVVREGQQVLVTQFGEIRGEPITKAGLHFKIPMIQEARVFDKRILSWDGDPEQITTKEKKYILVDTTARWRIKDLRKFAESVISERGARDRLDGILDGVTRDIISGQRLVEAVRTSNSILDKIKENKSKSEADKAANGGENLKTEIEEEVTGDIESIRLGRQKLSQLIAERASTELAKLGIELIDVQLRRIAYEKSVEDKVYDRMISERKRIAEKIRSIGKGEEAKIRGRLNLDLKQIESEAYRKSQNIRGKAEKEAIEIYAASLGADPSYYTFRRTLDAYRKTIKDKSNVILSTDAEFLNLLDKRP